MGWAHAAKMSVSINVQSWNVSTRAACMRALGILVDALTLSLSFAVSFFPCSDRPSAHQDDLPVHQQADCRCPHSHHGLLLRRHRCAHGGGCCTVRTCMHSTTPRIRCSSVALPPSPFLPTHVCRGYEAYVPGCSLHFVCVGIREDGSISLFYQAVVGIVVSRLV